MPDDTQDAKAQKLAAARKKLKEYQQRASNNNSQQGAEEPVASSTQSPSSTVSIASNLSERSDSELNVNGGGAVAPLQQEQFVLPTAASYFTQNEPEHNGGLADTSNLQAIQVIIAEKAQLNAELTKVRLACRERELELEELRTVKDQNQLRLEQLQQHYQDQQSTGEEQRQKFVHLQAQLQQAQAQIDDNVAHLNELTAHLKQRSSRQEELQQELSQKSNELEMAQLKLRQLSDESSVSTDNRVESLVQTQYMYEQQIRDLQAMVGQLTQDKEQAAAQYQNYVQHQSGEIAKLNERNAELAEELNSLKERERQLVEHVGGLERDIQKNLSLQAQFKEANQEQLPKEESSDQNGLKEELAALKERIADLDFERHEFQLKIKSQDDQLQMKESALAETKLLATMESDKVAASRALTQNIEMKNQLDELQQRFVQLTNDKAELVIRLDAEEFANREIRQNYTNMEQKLHANEERFKFKDEEMIRLSHENVELQRQQLMMQQQLDRLQHYEAKAYHSQEGKQREESGDAPVNESEEATDHGHLGHSHVHPQDHSQDHAHEHQHDRSHEHSHDHFHDHVHDNAHDHAHHHSHDHDHEHSHDHDHGPAGKTLPTAEAVERLQSRFTTLISQVADLTEEKHSLEHLVLQLQSETETIGEYIALYQTQRRMLKQREYEKAAQMRLLQAEREQLREKIETLNKLVVSLGVELPQDPGQSQQQEAAASTVQPANEGENSQQIINKIQDIISEIKENTEQPTHNHAGDHLNCCLGKFEVV
ncbi:hypothetical protein M5D96_011357 [Drosophila gunungcola]|uniref:Golgin subfamily A conserved domain-containing protein n=1 Tax=Drosophila gunungcola TaxID=103775 RepID=A0A9P9YFK7_9MUSC|nr:hypothetical protein M5D96_011357 [Drosophila gunungcola]